MDYIGSGRSNYIKTTDVEAFKALCKRFNLSVIGDEKMGWGCIARAECGEPELLEQYIDEDEILNDEILYDDILFEDMCNTLDDDFFFEIINLIQPDEVFIWQHIGNEGHKYFYGYSLAINSKGVRKEVNINDIYDQLKDLGTNISRAEY